MVLVATIAKISGPVTVLPGKENICAVLGVAGLEYNKITIHRLTYVLPCAFGESPYTIRSTCDALEGMMVAAPGRRTCNCP